MLCLLGLAILEPSGVYACSFIGGGVLSAELMSSSLSSEAPEAAGDAEEWSLSLFLDGSEGVDPSWFIVTRTEAASSN